MAENNQMTKKELKVLRKLERMEQEKQGGGSNTTKWIVFAVGAALFLAFFAFVVILIKQSKSKPVEISTSGWIRGKPDAKVTLIEYGDFQCPACKAAEPLVRQAQSEFKDDLKFVFKHFPLTSIHPNAVLGARAAEAAGIQGKFWEMHDWLYDYQEMWSALPAVEALAKIKEQANALDLDVEKFGKDMDDPTVLAKITAEQNEGIEIGVNATPTFYLNGKKIDGSERNYEEFKKVISEEISKSKK